MQERQLSLYSLFKNPSIMPLGVFLVYFSLKSLFAVVDVSKFKDGRVHYSNSGMTKIDTYANSVDLDETAHNDQ